MFKAVGAEEIEIRNTSANAVWQKLNSQLVYLIICQLWLFATSWEHCTVLATCPFAAFCQ
jgi:hypothetical protein